MRPSLPRSRALVTAALCAAAVGACVAVLRGYPAIAAAVSAGIAGLLAYHATMAERRARVAEDRNAEAVRLAAAGLATAGFLHELRNALMVLAGFAELARNATAAEDRARRHVEEVERQARRLRDRLRTFLDTARGGATGEQAPFGASLEEIRTLIRPVALERGLILETDIADGLGSLHDAGRIRTIGLDLALNAIAHARTRVLLRADHDEGALVLRVEDDGDGVEPALRTHLFEPFVSLRDGGTGIGLASAASLAREEGGSVTCEASSLGGAAFVLRLPAREGRSGDDSASVDPTSVAVRNGGNLE